MANSRAEQLNLNRAQDSEFPLHRAAAAGRVDLCRELLAQGADVDEQDEEGWTALHLAASRLDIDFVEVLLGARADASIRCRSGESASDLACSEMPFDIGQGEVKALIDSAERRGALQRLAEKSRTESDLASPEEVMAKRGKTLMM